MDSGNFLGYSDFRIVFVYWPCHVPCGILVPQPEIESMPFALKARSLNHWTAREVHGVFFFFFGFVFLGSILVFVLQDSTLFFNLTEV